MNTPLDREKAHQMVEAGAQLVDVRTRREFAGGHLEGAVNIPLPVEGSTLNFTAVVQTQAMLTEAGSVDGTGWAWDVFARRTRILVIRDATNLDPKHAFIIRPPSIPGLALRPCQMC